MRNDIPGPRNVFHVQREIRVAQHWQKDGQVGNPNDKDRNVLSSVQHSSDHPDCLFPLRTVPKAQVGGGLRQPLPQLLKS